MLPAVRDDTAAFLGQLDPEQRHRLEGDEIESYWRTARNEARAQWPGIDLPAEVFAAHVGAVASRLDLRSAVELESLQVGDLYLACACARGVRPAVAALRRTFFADIETALRRFGLAADASEEIQQNLFDEVSTLRNGRVPIAAYSGRGPLRRWLRSIAIRQASRRVARERRDVQTHRELHTVLRQLDEDVEVEHLRKNFLAEYEAALAGAVQSLQTEERNILRQYFIDGLSIDELGRLYQVHRSTAARRVTRARDRVSSSIVDGLRRQLGMSPSEIAEVGRIVRSRIDVSLTRLLR